MNSICVYCGSSFGDQPAFAKAARQLANVMNERSISLVYGGASVGIMGEIANAVLAGGGIAIGVIPQALADKEVSHTGLTELHIVSSMHERKALMAEISDGFIALPGGFGTLEE
ncbi:MAG: TIGR00730 family Rossman fold protein, partial [Gammaproteobacteria bacterium]|nr:TIGR00730 family Rossman fold protein [Gammaproteobacteria bacterium]